MERKGGDDDDASPYHEDVEDDRGYEYDQRRAGQVLRTRPRHDSTVAEKFLLFQWAEWTREEKNFNFDKYHTEKT